MKYHILNTDECYIKVCCHTCEMMMYDPKNNIMVCAGNDKGAKPYGYGDEIINDLESCKNYDISFHEFCNFAPHQLDNYNQYLF